MASITAEDFILSNTMGGQIYAMCSALAVLYNRSDVDHIYPVGSIYISTSSTSPATLFGGTWNQIQGKFLVANGNGYNPGSSSTGSSVTLETKNARHSHTFGGTEQSVSTGVALDFSSSTDGYYALKESNPTIDVNPPYLAVYMWERIA